ncbi:unnamed protein product [Urochloa humidicola]
MEADLAAGALHLVVVLWVHPAPRRPHGDGAAIGERLLISASPPASRPWAAALTDLAVTALAVELAVDGSDDPVSSPLRRFRTSKR